MNVTDVYFGVTTGVQIPEDHGYALYAAISGILPWVHSQNSIGLHTIEGRFTASRSLLTNERSALIIRTSFDSISDIIGLSGMRIKLHGSQLRIGDWWNRPLRLSECLHSRLVTTKNGLDTFRFERELRRQLDALEVSSNVLMKIGKRRTVRIKGRLVVGYAITLSNLSKDESLSVQRSGIGGRRKMGCGVFSELQGQMDRKNRYL
jgi:CRISPR-associated protein Cas6